MEVIAQRCTTRQVAIIENKLRSGVLQFQVVFVFMHEELELALCQVTCSLTQPLGFMYSMYPSQPCVT